MKNTTIEKQEVKVGDLTELLNSLGISRNEQKNYNLILHNDPINDMMHVSLALYEICKLSNEEAIIIMMEAHNNGKAVAKSGTEEDMLVFKQGLNDRGIDATVELA